MRPGERSDDVADQIVFEHQSELAFVSTAIVADGKNIFGAAASERLNEIIGKTCATKTPKHDARTVGDVSDSVAHAGINFLFHELSVPRTQSNANREIGAPREVS